jgi:hypothetical protein
MVAMDAQRFGVTIANIVAWTLKAERKASRKSA